MLSQPLRDLLQQVGNVLWQHGVDYFIVGAVARDIQLSAVKRTTPLRKTNDLDVALLINDEAQFIAIKESLVATGLFEAVQQNPVKLIFQHAIELDLLPFGGIVNEQLEARISKPTVFVMDVPGFKEAHSSAITWNIEGANVNICSLEGLVLLKLLAYGDNSSRTKDLTDIDHIISAYFELCHDKIYEEHFDLMEQYNTTAPDYLEVISARVIGRIIRDLLADSTRVKLRVEATLQKRPVATWQALLSGLNDPV